MLRIERDDKDGPGLNFRIRRELRKGKRYILRVHTHGINRRVFGNYTLSIGAPDLLVLSGARGDVVPLIPAVVPIIGPSDEIYSPETTPTWQNGNHFGAVFVGDTVSRGFVLLNLTVRDFVMGSFLRPSAWPGDIVLPLGGAGARFESGEALPFLVTCSPDRRGFVHAGIAVVYSTTRTDDPRSLETSGPLRRIEFAVRCVGSEDRESSVAEATRVVTGTPYPDGNPGEF